MATEGHFLILIEILEPKVEVQDMETFGEM